MPLLTNIATLATCAQPGGQGALHTIARAALAWEQESIVWVGKEVACPERFTTVPRIDAGGALVVPGLIDCHTHLAFGGWRADEFEERILGKSYLEIARSGGGIAGTVRHTRADSEEVLFNRCCTFLREMGQMGVSTVECKSGYGLTLDDEAKLLRVYRRLAHHQPLRIAATFLGAHVVPPEYRNDRPGYIRLLCEEMIPRFAAEGLAEFCDVFVEETAFSIGEARHILEAGKKHGLRPKLHVDQLRDGGGACLAAEVGAISADHLEYASADGIRAMADAGVVAVSLPIATLYLNQRPMPARRFVEAGVPVAVATDFNPGSAPSFHLPLALTLACTMNRMTPAEALKGATLFAAQAIGREKRIGSLEVGKQADFVLIDAPDVNHWIYHFRANAVQEIFVRGKAFNFSGDGA